MSDSKSNRSGGRKRTDAYLRAFSLSILLALAAWWAFWGEWPSVAAIGVVVLTIGWQWWNERSKR
jgi:hypothetical protein